MSTGAALLEKLENAPIDEVVCGIAFAPIPLLDLIVLGSYWKKRQSDFPGHELRQEVRSGLLIGMMQLRALLISPDDAWVLQLQNDRFYLNWRKRQGGYPRFSSVGGHVGVLAKALGEFRHLQSFCNDELATVPQINGIELAKVDVFREGEYWNGLDDLVRMLPWLHDYAAFATSGRPTFAMRFDEPRTSGTLSMSCVLGAEQRPGTEAIRTLRVETRLAVPAVGDTIDQVEKKFVDANAELNQVFASLIPRPEREKRFQESRK